MSASQVRKKQEERSLQTLREIASQPHNKRCAECQQRGPTYADMTTLTFVCTSCSGHLRGLNPPHRLKSISMTTFTEAEIMLLRSGGNEASKAKWLAKWDSKKDREPDGKDDSQLVHFLREKYEKRIWYSEVPVKPQSDTGAQKEPSQISISKPPEVVKSPQRQPSLDARPRPTQSTSQSNLVSASTNSVKEATPPTKPKVDFFGGQNDPFGPSPDISPSSTHKKPPAGAVSVFPPGGAPLVHGGQQSDEFGAFTSSQSTSLQSTNKNATVSLQGVSGTTRSSSATGPDKYSALAQLDVAVKEVTLKDNPPSVESSNESWGSASVNPFGAGGGGAAQPGVQPQQNPFMAGGVVQQGFGQFVSAQPTAQQGWGQPQGSAYANPQQGSFGNAQFQGQAGFAASGGFAQQPQQGMFGAGGATQQFSGAFPSQPVQGQWQSQPSQQWSQQQQWQHHQQQQQHHQPQQQQPVFGSAGQSFGVSKSTSATTTMATTTSMQLGWSASMAKPLATTTSSTTSGWSSALTTIPPQPSAIPPQPSAQLNWNTPAAVSSGTVMQQPNMGGPSMPQHGGGWGSVGQQSMFGTAPQQNQMFAGAPGLPQQNPMYMGQPQMFGGVQPLAQQSFRPVGPQQQMFGMPNQQSQQPAFGTWSQNSVPQSQQGGFNWSNPSGPQRKDSKNIIVGNWGTQPSNFQQPSDMSNYIPNSMNTSSNPFTASSNKGTSNNPFL